MQSENGTLQHKQEAAEQQMADLLAALEEAKGLQAGGVRPVSAGLSTIELHDTAGAAHKPAKAPP